MDLASIIYAFILTLGAKQFVVNDYVVLDGHAIEVDVQTLGLREEQRYILLVDAGRITQHARVPVVEAECKQPH